MLSLRQNPNSERGLVSVEVSGCQVQWTGADGYNANDRNGRVCGVRSERPRNRTMATPFEDEPMEVGANHLTGNVSPSSLAVGPGFTMACGRTKQWKNRDRG
jgi:hypothetical protein